MPYVATMLSLMYDNADHHSAIKKYPANTRKIDGFVLLLYSVEKPKTCRKEISGPGNQRHTADILSNPNGQYLRQRQKHGRKRMKS
jgi:hypothetical protein